MDFDSAQRVLLTAGVRIEAGLSSGEFETIERTFGFRFPPDLREFLSTGLPVSGGWVDWRGSDTASIQERMDWPFAGMCFDIEENGFWLNEWGPKPNDLKVAIETAQRAVRQAPVLIPICNHRYIPAEPNDAGNPIFSVHQTDIIYYGVDLMDYLQNEFSYYFGRVGYRLVGVPKRIPFWSNLVE